MAPLELESNPARWHVALLTCALLFTATAPVACGGAGAETHAEPLAQVEFDAARAWKDLETIVALGPRQSGTAGAEKTRVLIESGLRDAGFEPQRESFTPDTPEGPLKMANVYADLPGSGDDARTIILCTHYDTKRIPPIVGANDGGSGTAVLLELARSLKQAPPSSYTYRFLFLDGEESVREQWADPDNRYGSRQHAAGLERSGQLERIAAVVLIDLVGDKELVLEDERYSDQEILTLFFEAAREGGLGSHVPNSSTSPQSIKDDHLSFLEVGLRSIDLIDLNYGPWNSYWHSMEDTLEHCSEASLDAIGRIVLLGLPRLESLLAGS